MSEFPQRIGFGVATSAQPYASGSIKLYVAVSNDSRADLTIQFDTAQRFDFALKDPKGAEYWRWSAEQEFEQVAGSITVKSRRTYAFDIDLAELPTPAGDRPLFVDLEGKLTSSDITFTAVLRLLLVPA